MFLVADRLVGGQRLRRDALLCGFDGFNGVDRLTGLAAGLFTDAEAENRAQPTPQLRRLAQFRQFLPRGDECFLREILALAHAAGRAKGQRADESLVPFDNFSECVLIAVEAFGHKFAVVLLRRLHCFGFDHICL